MAQECRVFRPDLSRVFVDYSDQNLAKFCQGVGMIDFKAMGARIAEQRRRAGLRRQEDLASQLEVEYSRSAIAGIESGGDDPSLKLAICIANRLKLPMDWMLGRKVPPGGPLVGQFVHDPDELAWLDFWRNLLPEERPLVTKMLRVGQIGKIDR